MFGLKPIFKQQQKSILMRSEICSAAWVVAVAGLAALTLTPATLHAQTFEEPTVLGQNGQPLGDQAIDPFNRNPNPLAELDAGRQNLPADTSNITNDVLLNEDDGSAPGLSFGAFTLRPSIQTQILHESEKNGSTKQSRTYNQTSVSATLNSDWTRHSLNISAIGQIEKNISGDLQESPNADIDAVLELELSEAYTATLSTGYFFNVENQNDPNAIASATSQANNHVIEGSLALARDVGTIRGTLTAGIMREIFGNAELADGSSVSRSERDFTAGDLTLRLGLGGGQALRPFIEGNYGRSIYDQTRDSSGLERSFTSYALRLGTELDLADKASGEFAVGYSSNNFDDATLLDIDIFTIDGNIDWSPVRGTGLSLALSTALEPSTSSGSSGSSLYAIATGLTHEFANNWDLNLDASYSLRNFEDSVGTPSETIYGIGVGLDWSINRYLSMNADADYSKTIQDNVDDIDNWTVGLGLTLSR